MPDIWFTIRTPTHDSYLAHIRRQPIMQNLILLTWASLAPDVLSSSSSGNGVPKISSATLAKSPVSGIRKPNISFADRFSVCFLVPKTFRGALNCFFAFTGFEALWCQGQIRISIGMTRQGLKELTYVRQTRSWNHLRQPTEYWQWVHMTDDQIHQMIW